MKMDPIYRKTVMITVALKWLKYLLKSILAKLFTTYQIIACV